MIKYLLGLLTQTEESLITSETNNQTLVHSISALSDGLSEMDQLLENHFNKTKHQNYDL